MTISFTLLVILVIIALSFDFLNGLHDAANSIATIVATRVMQPHWAVLFAAAFNFLAIFVVGLHVAETVGKGIVDANIVTPGVIFAALMGAIVWNVVTWLSGIPSSSSHALIGGLLGAGIAKAGTAAVVLKGTLNTIFAIALSPTLGLVLALLLVLVVAWTSLKLTPLGVDRRFRRLQLISSAIFSLSHGGNDAQKTMGIISVLLYSQGILGDKFYVPWWVIVSCYVAIALGTMSGGWRIVKTMGSRITRLTPAQGFCAETGAATTIYLATWLGIPVSSTHTITGSIVGVGASRRLSAVRWNVASTIVVAWVVTLPAAGLIAAATWWLTDRMTAAG